MVVSVSPVLSADVTLRYTTGGSTRRRPWNEERNKFEKSRQCMDANPDQTLRTAIRAMDRDLATYLPITVGIPTYITAPVSISGSCISRVRGLNSKTEL